MRIDKSRTVLLPVCMLLSSLTNMTAAPGDGPALPKSDVFVIPFSHLDLYWGGTQEECLSRGNRILTKAIQLAEKYPQLRFLMEDEVFVANFVDSQRGTPELETLKSL